LLTFTNSVPQIDFDAYVSVLTFLWIPEPKTIFKSFHKFPAGHSAFIDENFQLNIQKYYELPTSTITAPPEKILEELSDITEQSVAAHMVSDVPVSCFLSGGLDSSLITAIAAQKTAYKLKTFTTIFREQDKKFEAMPDDQKYARLIAEQLETDHHEILLEPDLTRMLPMIMYHLDEPIADPAAINTFLICKAARDQGIKVILSGMGADEVLGGYRKHYAMMVARAYQRRIPAIIRHRIVSPLIRRMPVAGRNRGFRYLRWSKRFNRFANTSEEEAFRLSYSYYTPQELSDLLHPDLHRHSNYPVEAHQKIFSEFSDDDPINRMCKTDVKLFLKSLNLAYTDRASMAASVEVRTPFVDSVFTDYALRIPGKYKVKGKIQKWILKQVARKWLPPSVINRPKAPFGAPIRSWMTQDLKVMLMDILSAEKVKKRGLLNHRAIETLIFEDSSGHEDNAHRLWALLSLEIWMDQYGL